jgi:hypothetical protein
MALVFVKVLNVHLGAGRWMAGGGMQDQGEVGTLQQGIATGPAQLVGLITRHTQFLTQLGNSGCSKRTQSQKGPNRNIKERAVLPPSRED